MKANVEVEKPGVIIPISSPRRNKTVNSSREIDYSTNANRFHSLDAVRGLAALWVVSVHAAYFLNETHNTGILKYLYAGFRYGYLGVQIFFVISGYTITAALYNYQNRGLSPMHFFLRRCKRIFPVYWASMGFTLLLGLITMIAFKRSFTSIFPFNLFQWFMNVILMQGPLRSDVGLGYWFLSVMVQYYVIAFFVLFFERYMAWYLFFITIIFSLMLLYFHPFSVDGSILKYWNQFAVGIGLFYIIHKTDKPFAKALFILILSAGASAFLFLISGEPIKDIAFSPARGDIKGELFFCLFAGALLLFLHPYDQKVSEWRIMKFFSFVGMFSYSLYLTHAPIITRVFNLGKRTTGYDGPKFILFFIVGLGIAVVFAYLFFKLFEEPFIKGDRAETFISFLKDRRLRQKDEIPAAQEDSQPDI